MQYTPPISPSYAQHHRYLLLRQRPPPPPNHLVLLLHIYTHYPNRSGYFSSYYEYTSTETSSWCFHLCIISWWDFLLLDPTFSLQSIRLLTSYHRTFHAWPEINLFYLFLEKYPSRGQCRPSAINRMGEKIFAKWEFSPWQRCTANH